MTSNNVRRQPILTCVSPGVPLQVKRVIEALAAEGAEVPFDIAVTLEMSVEKALEVKHLGADATLELGRVGVRPECGQSLRADHVGKLIGQWILNSIATVDELHRRVRTQAKLKHLKAWYSEPRI